MHLIQSPARPPREPIGAHIYSTCKQPTPYARLVHTDTHCTGSLQHTRTADILLFSLADRQADLSAVTATCTPELSGRTAVQKLGLLLLSLSHTQPHCPPSLSLARSGAGSARHSLAPPTRPAPADSSYSHACAHTSLLFHNKLKPQYLCTQISPTVACVIPNTSRLQY